MNLQCDEPLVSIVLPTHNGQRYLAEAINSVILQTHTNWELIIVDDCSTDATSEIISGFTSQDSRIRSVRNKRNRKLPGALNVGFTLAKGQLLTWTSDDNKYHPEALETMVEYLAENPDIDFVYAGCLTIDPEGLETGRVSVKDPELLVDYNHLGACFLYRRKVYDTVGDYAEDLFCAEDYDYWLRVSAKFKMARIDKPLYDYRLHSDTLTGIYTPSHIYDKAMEALDRNLPTLAWVAPEPLADAHLKLTRWAFNQKKYALARQHLRACLKPRWPELIRRDREMLATLLLGPKLGGAIVRSYLVLRGRKKEGKGNG